MTDDPAAEANKTSPDVEGNAPAESRVTSGAKKTAAAKPASARTTVAAQKSATPKARPAAKSASSTKPEPVAAPEATDISASDSAAASDSEQSAGTEEPAEEAAHDVAASRPSGLRVLIEAGRPGRSRAQLVVALLCGLLGFGLVTQVHSSSGSGLNTARESDLVDILDSLSARSDQLRSQIATEEAALAKLTGGTDRTQAALEEAQQRAATLQILAGTVPAVGAGIELNITDSQHRVTADVLLGILEELRDAGAEAVQITGSSAAAGGAVTPTAKPGASGRAVRLVASSFFVDSQDSSGIVVDGVLLAPPFDIFAIGDPHTMTAAMGIPGGVLDTLARKSAKGTVVEHDVVRVTALHELTPPQYAHPAASSSGG